MVLAYFVGLLFWQISSDIFCFWSSIIGVSLDSGILSGISSDILFGALQSLMLF